MTETLDTILNTEYKVKILRLFTARQEGYQATGREVARAIGTTAPTAHAALKALYDQHILLMDAIGRNHLYTLNRRNRIVNDILVPAFSVEKNFKKDASVFISRKIKDSGLEDKIVSVIFYGSRQAGTSGTQSDADVAVIVDRVSSEQKVLDFFLDQAAPEFYEYFGASLDPYVKSKKAFLDLWKKNRPPVSTLKRSYDVIYGQDILNKGDASCTQDQSG